MDKLSLMAGVDIPVPELQLTLHPPQLREIALIGEADFFAAMQYVCLDKQMLVKDIATLGDYSNFQVLMKLLQQPEVANKKSAILNLLSLIFPLHSPMMTPNSILLNNRETKETTLIDNNNFNIFQQVLSQILCVNSIFQGDNVVYNPANAAAARIAQKLMAGRRKVAEIKSKESKDSVIARYVSILSVGLGWTVADCLNLTMYQLFDIMERYTLYVNYDTDLRVRLAGGDPKTEVENWMKPIHD